MMIKIKETLVGYLRSKEFQFLWESLYNKSKLLMNFWGGAYVEKSGEIHAMKYAISKLKKQSILVFDGGANTGQYVTSICSMLRRKKINPIFYSFEPSSFTYDLLVKHLERIGLENVKPIKSGLGQKFEKTILYSLSPGLGTSSIYNDNEGAEGSKLREEIVLITIDDFCYENNIERIDFLKLDIEGHEYSALLGAKKMLEQRRISFVQFEFGECHINSRTFMRDFYQLLSPNYNFYRIVSNGLRPIHRYSSDLEIFSTINYLCELRN